MIVTDKKILRQKSKKFNGSDEENYHYFERYGSGEWNVAKR